MNELARLPVLQVSELTRTIKALLEEGFSHVTVEGEISNSRKAASGHHYFVMKDSEAVLQCVLFNHAARRSDQEPRDGELVRASGSISVYPPRGAYQLIVRSLEQAGYGRILAMLEDRKRRLQEAGVFDRSLPLPYFPRTAAVITSPGGAAIRDILQVLRRRGATVNVRLLPVVVQGAGAGAAIARMVRYAARHKLGEVILVTRGGGSLEDLLPFSEEAVVRAIAESPLPVISAVGHEVDWALSDFAADYRAPTPSAAAEILSAGAEEVRERVHRSGTATVRDFLSRLDRLHDRYSRVSVDEIRYRYRNYVQPWYQRLDALFESIHRGIVERENGLIRRVEIAKERIEGASPFAALNRGYAIVRDRRSEAILTRSEKISPGDSLSIQFTDGTVAATADADLSTPESDHNPATPGRTGSTREKRSRSG
jgi:exodeoxyribonuclease VII large subunit